MHVNTTNLENKIIYVMLLTSLTLVEDFCLFVLEILKMQIVYLARYQKLRGLSIFIFLPGCISNCIVHKHTLGFRTWKWEKWGVIVHTWHDVRYVFSDIYWVEILW